MQITSGWNETRARRSPRHGAQQRRAALRARHLNRKQRRPRSIGPFTVNERAQRAALALQLLGDRLVPRRRAATATARWRASRTRASAARARIGASTSRSRYSSDAVDLALQVGEDTLRSAPRRRAAARRRRSGRRASVAAAAATRGSRAGDGGRSSGGEGSAPAWLALRRRSRGAKLTPRRRRATRLRHGHAPRSRSGTPCRASVRSTGIHATSWRLIG